MTATSVPYSRLNPFPAPLITNKRLSAPESNKEIRHYAFDLAGSGLTYQPGYSFGLYPTNNPREVDELLRVSGLTGKEVVTPPKSEVPMPLIEALSSHLMLSDASRKLLEDMALSSTVNASDKDKLQTLLKEDNAALLQEQLKERLAVEWLIQFPSARLTATQLVECLKKLHPRIYSIASSPLAAGNTVELTVATVRYHAAGRARGGVASTFLADRSPIGAHIPVFIKESKFLLPESNETPIIMIGPGTGVAPFRAFLQHRAALGAMGKNWLFFGAPRQAHDFLYREEIEVFLKKSVLSRLNLAWSRDQEDRKVYVQHHMMENSRQLWDWLQQGATVYVCGDAKEMAKDVHATLLAIAAKEGAMEPAAAEEYILALKTAGRYLRDVY